MSDCLSVGFSQCWVGQWCPTTLLELEVLRYIFIYLTFTTDNLNYLPTVWIWGWQSQPGVQQQCVSCANFKHPASSYKKVFVKGIGLESNHGQFTVDPGFFFARIFFILGQVDLGNSGRGSFSLATSRDFAAQAKQRPLIWVDLHLGPSVHLDCVFAECKNVFTPVLCQGWSWYYLKQRFSLIFPIYGNVITYRYIYIWMFQIRARFC